ncbi:MAG: hypothetical protein ACR2HH_01885 [Chthoniobacterales bacterium]
MKKARRLMGVRDPDGELESLLRQGMLTEARKNHVLVSDDHEMIFDAMLRLEWSRRSRLPGRFWRVEIGK